MPACSSKPGSGSSSTFARSRGRRTNPQFNVDTLPASLAAWQIGYRHLRELGGLRGHRKDQGPSSNTYWENLRFRNYADYTATATFRAGLAELIVLGCTQICAIMCAEAVWWRCHRRIVADYLISEGERVFHIMGAGKVEPARLNPAAVRQHDGTPVYPVPPSMAMTGRIGPEERRLAIP